MNNSHVFLALTIRVRTDAQGKHAALGRRGVTNTVRFREDMFGKRQLKAELLTALILVTLFLQCAAPAAFAEETAFSGESQTAVQEETTPAAPAPAESAPAEAAPAPAPAESAPAAAAPAPAEAAPAQEAAPEEEAEPAQGEAAPTQEEPVPEEDTAAPQEDAASAPEEPVPEEDAAPAQEDSAAPQDAASAQEEAAPPEEAAPAEETAAEEDTAQGIANNAVYYYRSKEDDADIPDTYIYDDDLLKGNSLVYRPELATMSLCLVNASISSTRGVYGDDGDNSKSRNLRAYLEDNGFKDFEANQDYSVEPTLDTMGVACAHKKITDNGRVYTLLVIAPRSAGYKAEWGRNFTIGESGDHEGFSYAKDIVLSFTREYIEKTGISGDIKIWVAGASRGAGVVNLLGAELLRDSAAALGDSVSLSPENLYCYTFGTPHTADVTSEDYIVNNETKYAYIHNHSESDDIVGTFPPSDLYFDRYGETRGYYDNENKESMLTFLKAISEKLYNKFIQGGDPDSFTSLDLDYNKLIEKMSLSFKPVSEDSYLYGKTQEDFLDLLESAMMAVFQDRSNYSEQYEDTLEHFFGYVYGQSGELGKLFSGIKGSKYAIPTAAGMFLSMTLERSLKQELKTTGSGTRESMKEAVEEVDAAIEDLELDDETLEQYNSVKDSVASDGLPEGLSSKLVDALWSLTAAFYSKAMEDGLANITTLDDAVKELLTSEKDSMGMTKALSYLLLYDDEQEDTLGLKQAKEQISRLATTIGNAKSFLTPHYNEVILAWMRTKDPNYQDVRKADNAQTTGYRRVFVEQPQGVDVTCTVRNSAGDVVAVCKNGELISTTNAWIGVTTSDDGNWIRLPIDDTYRIDFTTSADTAINIKVSEYSVESAKEVRVETSDSNYDWNSFTIRPVDAATLVVSAVDEKDGVYVLNSGASYYVDLLKRFLITYDLNGGTLNGNGSSITTVFDSGTSLTLPIPYREGYRFVYWEGSRYNAGDLYTVTVDHVFKAIWEKIQEESREKPGKQKKKSSKKKSGEKGAGNQEPSSARQEVSPLPAGSSAEEYRVMAVQTGDTSPVVLLFMLMGLSMFFAAGAAAFLKSRR